MCINNFNYLLISMITNIRQQLTRWHSNLFTSWTSSKSQGKVLTVLIYEHTTKHRRWARDTLMLRHQKMRKWYINIKISLPLLLYKTYALLKDRILLAEHQHPKDNCIIIQMNELVLYQVQDIMHMASHGFMLDDITTIHHKLIKSHWNTTFFLWKKWL